jgi:hypothetical protein
MTGLVYVPSPLSGHHTLDWFCAIPAAEHNSIAAKEDKNLFIIVDFIISIMLNYIEKILFWLKINGM